MKTRDQLGMFAGSWVRPATLPRSVHELAVAIPRGVTLGTSSWSFPGWAGLVYDRPADASLLAREGLGPYARHPLFGVIGVDRGFYAPVPVADWRTYRDQVPPDFRFVIKAPRDALLARYPDHARYGAQRGRPSARFLDPSWVEDVLIGPATATLGAARTTFLFQIPPQDPGPLTPDALHRFLSALPDASSCAVEPRYDGAVCRAYGDAVHDAGALHCLSVHPRMPDLRTQWQLGRVAEAPKLLVRWNLLPSLTYAAAKERFQPFTRLGAPDLPRRDKLARAVCWAVDRERPVDVVIGNKAEGSAPLSVVELIRRIRELRRPA